MADNPALLDIGGTKLEKLKRARTGYQTGKTNFNNQYAALSQYYYQIQEDYQHSNSAWQRTGPEYQIR